MGKGTPPRGLRGIALIEAAKGAVVLLAGFGLLALVHQDVQTLAEMLVHRLHLDAARRYPRIFIDAASHVTDARLWLLAGLAMLYACARLVEAYGLWKGRRWAEWFALVTASVYVPLEILAIIHRVTWIKVLALIVNSIVVGYMAYVLYREARTQNSESRRQEIGGGRLRAGPKAPAEPRQDPGLVR
jgi:uncharacterized membrane protein (DUF2068 family)